jgi:hypothetical protein
MTKITCKCRTCKGNNNGQPLSALIPEALAAKIGKDIHGTVWTAHEPGPLGAAVRAAAGIKAA